jgi:hypothetical protein
LFAAGEARSAGWGGLAVASKITRLVVRRSIAGRMIWMRRRCAGGGRRAVSEDDPGLVRALERLVEPPTLGDPMRPLFCVSKSMEKVAATLTEVGHPIT